MSYNCHLKNSKELFREYELGKEIVNINDIIELYNAIKYFNDKAYNESIIKYYLRIIAKYFKSITSANFITFYNDVDIEYSSDFWEVIEKFKIYKNISDAKFREFITSSKVWLCELLKYKKVTEHFGKIIRDYMLKDFSSAELLLDKFEIRHINEKEPLYFPKELSNADKETIICNYINSDKPNLNYLRLIANIQSNKDKIEITNRTLLKSKKKVEELEKQLFNENSGMLMETIVHFSKTQHSEVITKMEGQSLTLTYSTRWLEENMDYATLLNNFIYLFDYVDLQMRCIFVNKFNQMGVFERFIITSSRNAYRKGIAFERMNVLTLLQMTGYYNELFSIGIRLEEVIEWFFEIYLSNEFNVQNFKVSMPSTNSTFLEKCTNIMPAMEFVLKQFSLFVQEGKIDFELLEISSEHLIYKAIPSIVSKKYVYGVGDEYKYVTFLLFSDQSGLGYNEKSKKSYDSYYELLCNEKVNLNEYADYCITDVKWLVDNKYLSTDNNGYIILSNKPLILILKDLYNNEVVSYWRYSQSERTIIDCLADKNMVEFEDLLFSRPEQDYINYYLNKSQFNNGLDLRNKYSHTQPNIGDDEKIHRQNYMIFLRLFILSVIKINDDFCLAYDNNLIDDVV